MKLAEVNRPDAAAQNAALEAVGGMIALRTKLHRQAQSAEVGWAPAELALLSAALPELKKQAAGGPLARLVAAAARDVELQGGRADEVTGLVAKHSRDSRCRRHFLSRPIRRRTETGGSGRT